MMPEHNTTPELVTLKSVANKINKLTGLTPHAEALREWMNSRSEDEYWHMIKAIKRVHEKFDFIIGSWGIGSSFELYAMYCANKEVAYVSPKKINRKREWRKNQSNDTANR